MTGRFADLRHFNSDPDPAFYWNADPDPAIPLNEDPDPTPYQRDLWSTEPPAWRNVFEKSSSYKGIWMSANVPIFAQVVGMESEIEGKIRQQGEWTLSRTIILEQ